MHAHACTPLVTPPQNASTQTISSATAVGRHMLQLAACWHPPQVVWDALQDRIYGILCLFFQQGTYCYALCMKTQASQIHLESLSPELCIWGHLDPAGRESHRVM